MRTRVYVDGFNLYYGGLRKTPYRWLDVVALCGLLLKPECQIDKVRYFTARVSARPNDPDQATRQQTYLRALSTRPEIELHFGHFLSHAVDMPDAVALQTGRIVPRRVMKTEEKGSDVNLASWLLLDAFDDRFDLAVVISNDSDLATPIEMVRRRFTKTIGLLYPHKHVSQKLRPLASFLKPIRTSALAAAQFPSQLTDAAGSFHKPVDW